MQTILVPTDFSPNAYNAARYALALAADLKANKIILYNAYQPYVAEDPELDPVFIQNLPEFKKISEEGLAKMKNALQAEATAGITIVFESDYNIIASGITDAAASHRANIIIMGISGAESGFEEAIIGSTAIDVSRESELPVIIVPANATYSKLQKILLAVDFKKIAETTPVASIKKILDATQAQFDVLHVEANTKHTEPELAKEKNIFNALFEGYYPHYHFVQGENFTAAINDFAINNQSDIIIVIPKKHGFFEGIFKKSHAKALAFHSHVPIMSIHE